jgi:hypothetical protein
MNLLSVARLPLLIEVRGFAPPPHGRFAFSWMSFDYYMCSREEKIHRDGLKSAEARES